MVRVRALYRVTGTGGTALFRAVMGKPTSPVAHMPHASCTTAPHFTLQRKFEYSRILNRASPHMYIQEECHAHMDTHLTGPAIFASVDSRISHIRIPNVLPVLTWRNTFVPIPPLRKDLALALRVGASPLLLQVSTEWTQRRHV